MDGDAMVTNSIFGQHDPKMWSQIEKKEIMQNRIKQNSGKALFLVLNFVSLTCNLACYLIEKAIRNGEWYQ